MNDSQGVFTTVSRIRPDEVERLKRVLRDVGGAAEIASGVDLPEAAPREEFRVPFQDLRTTHFLRWVVLPEAIDAMGRPIPAQLLLSTCYDEPLSLHLTELVRVTWPVIAEVYRRCEGYGYSDSQAALVAYLRAAQVPSAAWYAGSPGRPLETIRKEAELRRDLELFLDAQTWDGRTAIDVRRAIQSYVLSKPELRWAMSSPTRTGVIGTITRYAPLAATLTAVLAAWPGASIALAAGLNRPFRPGRRSTAALTASLLLAPLALWAGRLRYHETRDIQTDQLFPDEQHLVEVELEEDWGQQNQFTKLVNVKPGPFRQFTLRLLLALTELACRYIFTRGQLLGIRTIHFANWTFVDGGRRLLFLSNFDGSWENYLSEFIDGSGKGLTAIYSNTENFPRSHWLTGGGTQDEQRYKAWVRNAQLTTEVWYRAYDDLTVVNVNNNSAIRAGLWTPMNESEAQTWLNRF